MKVLFRAKTINQEFSKETKGLKCINDVWYAIGSEYPCVAEELNGIKLCAIYGEDGGSYMCEYATRSINFEGMTNLKSPNIFASLSVFGKGGDIIDDRDNQRTLKFCQERKKLITLHQGIHWDITSTLSYYFEYAKVIGVQE